MTVWLSPLSVNQVVSHGIGYCICKFVKTCCGQHNLFVLVYFTEENCYGVMGNLMKVT